MKKEYLHTVTLKTTFNFENMPESSQFALSKMSDEEITNLLTESSTQILNERFFPEANEGNSWAYIEAVEG